MKKIYVAFLLQLLTTFVFSQWDSSTTSASNLVSRVSRGDFQVSVSDGADGVIAAWQSYVAVMIQRKTVAGKVKWNTIDSPVTVFTGVFGVGLLDMISDGRGGAYLSWYNITGQLTSDLYIQHVSAKGELLFGNAGKMVNSTAVTTNTSGRLCRSGDGVIIVWGNEIISPSYPNPHNSNLFIQHYDASGNAKWTADMPVSIAPGDKFFPAVVSDSDGGAFICFSDSRNSGRNLQGNLNNVDIYMQHIDSDGQRLWGSQDSVLTAEAVSELTYEAVPSLTINSSIVADDAGGFIIVFTSSDGSNLYSQRVNNNGSKAWDMPVRFVAVQNNKTALRVIPDGQHGMIATWQIYPANSSNYVLAQRVAEDGSLPWLSSPLVINGPKDEQMDVSGTGIAGDGLGNYVFTWRSGQSYDDNTYLKAQKISPAGNFIWNRNGVIVYAQPTTFQPYKDMLAPTAVTSTDGNVITVWDMHLGINAARLQQDGSLYNNAYVDFNSVKDGDWNSPTVWNNGVVPVQGADVIVTNNVVVNSNIICNSLKVIAPGSIIIAPGFSVTLTQ